MLWWPIMVCRWTKLAEKMTIIDTLKVKRKKSGWFLSSIFWYYFNDYLWISFLSILRSWSLRSFRSASVWTCETDANISLYADKSQPLSNNTDHFLKWIFNIDFLFIKCLFIANEILKSRKQWNISFLLWFCMRPRYLRFIARITFQMNVSMVMAMIPTATPTVTARKRFHFLRLTGTEMRVRNLYSDLIGLNKVYRTSYH